MLKRPDTVHLGTQYYRAPFPEQKYWQDDMRRMRDAGLDTVQLWVLWGWVEAEPDNFRYEDYDRLIEIAGENGLGVVLSTIAEIQPYWIHRLYPDCSLCGPDGLPIPSVNRPETHFGCTPGGCTDHPDVWARMSRFLENTAKRYTSVDHLVGWDAWNELRWNVEAHKPTCYCDHTVALYHEWLGEHYGSLDGLNEAWKRRYSCWEDVWPGKAHRLPYTDMMGWQHFLTDRACRHAKKRYDIIKGIDPDRPVTVHGGNPSPGYSGGGQVVTALDRGNDWGFADDLDGVGCSSFPTWFGMDDADFAARVEYVRSAARDKRVWLSEVQGGRAAQGFQVHKPVVPRDQQRWIWNGFACGADTMLFWCWRDEVFGCESGGYGIIGLDGLAEARTTELAVTGKALKEHGNLLAQYRPDSPEVGVLFAPQSYYMHWAQVGEGTIARQGLDGVCRALVRQAIPYRVLEEDHLDEQCLSGIKLIVLPRCTALSRSAQKRLSDWVAKGGTVLAESECGAFDDTGLYSYPEDRFLAKLSGVTEVGRRTLETESISLSLDGATVDLPVNQWLTPLAVPEDGVSHCDHPDGSLLVEAPAGEGKVLMLGSYASDAYSEGTRTDSSFEALISWACQTASCDTSVKVVSPTVDGDSFVHVRTGMSGGKRLVFVFAPDGVKEVALKLEPGMFQCSELLELRSGETRQLTDTTNLNLTIPDIGFTVLAEV